MLAKLRIAVGQMCSSCDLKRNARVVTKLIERAVELKARVLFLPEASDYISRDAANSVQLARRSKAEFLDIIRRKLIRVNTTKSLVPLSIAVGIHEPTTDDSLVQKVQNNQLWISEQGEVEQRYQKIHLFDIDIPNGPILHESKSVEAGKKILHPFPVSEDYPDFKVGFAICYDIRFPEMASVLRRNGAAILTYPSAFTTKTGEAHWLQLGRARAIDNQCFVVMAAQCGEHDVQANSLDLQHCPPDASSITPSKRVSYGQSLIVDPWGTVIAKARSFQEIDAQHGKDQDGDYYEIIEADLDLDMLRSVRKNLPLISHKRPEIYGV